MKLVVGLGNPGPEYVWSRHNAGWLILDSYVSRLGLREPRVQFGGAFWPASPLEGERVAWLKPHTYMNLSGKSVIEAARYFDVEPGDLFIVFDDVALPFGRLRYRESGSAGGQKGMISILGMMDSLDIPRLRVGVGAPSPQIDMKDWVLGKFLKEQRDAWPKVEELAWGALMKWLSGGAGPGFTLQLEPEKPGKEPGGKSDGRG